VRGRLWCSMAGMGIDASAGVGDVGQGGMDVEGDPIATLSRSGMVRELGSVITQGDRRRWDGL
jgi:hypothetical protein